MDAYDAYDALTEEQKEQVTGTEVFDDLFAVFNQMTNVLATVGGFNVEGDSSGYSYSGGVLTIHDGAELTISTSGQTTDRIAVASGATATITLNNVSIVTTNNNTPIDVSNNATLTLNLANGSQNTISVTSSLSTDCGSPGIHVPSGAQLTIQGEGSLSVTGASVSGGSWAGVGIGGRATGGVQTGEACGTVIILNGNISVTGGIGGGSGVATSGAAGQGIRPSASGSNTYDVYGALTLPAGVTLHDNITLNIPDGASLTLPDGASWPSDITFTGSGSISPKLDASITITANLTRQYNESPVSLDSNLYLYRKQNAGYHVV